MIMNIELHKFKTKSTTARTKYTTQLQKVKTKNAFFHYSMITYEKKTKKNYVTTFFIIILTSWQNVECYVAIYTNNI